LVCLPERPFPVLLGETPYGALLNDAGPIAGGDLAALTAENPYLVDRGYIQVSLDVRGTGSSEGSFDLFDPVQGQDGAIAARWAAVLPHSSGAVGLYGASYLGIDQFATAADAGPGSPIKAMFPTASATELYRDEVEAGGVPSLEFNLPYLAALLPGVSLANAATGGGATTVAAIGDQAYDGPYWQARSPISYIPQIVADHIPAFMVGGWFDLFQRGEPLNYAAFQNAYDGRPVLAPMTRAARDRPLPADRRTDLPRHRGERGAPRARPQRARAGLFRIRDVVWNGSFECAA
jgi:predicted acyl esterase